VIHVIAGCYPAFSASYVIPARAEHAGIIFETVAEAQTSVDPTKLTKAVEKFAADRAAKSRLASRVEATLAHFAQRTTRTAWRACSQRFSFHPSHSLILSPSLFLKGNP
jgi:hypothetical protein